TRRAVATIRLRDRSGDAPEQIAGCLDGLTRIVLDEVALLEHRDGVGRQRDGVPWCGRTHGQPRSVKDSCVRAIPTASAVGGLAETEGQARPTHMVAQCLVKSASRREIPSFTSQK